MPIAQGKPPPCDHKISPFTDLLLLGDLPQAVAFTVPHWTFPPVSAQLMPAASGTLQCPPAVGTVMCNCVTLYGLHHCPSVALQGA